MTIEKNYDLSKLNTFGIKANAKYFVELKTEADLVELFGLKEFKDNKKFFLGGGSNILFSKDFDGMVIVNKLKGINILKEDAENVLVRAMGGECWQDFVDFTVERGYWGIENLALIPGTVGASPIQNIGAYGTELKDSLLNVEAFPIERGEKRIFSLEECELGYRDSVFKNKLKDKYFISAVTLKLSKKEKKNLSYKILADYLEQNNIIVRGPKDISDTVASIRKSKLPDPKVLGNVGSFFKNVFVNQDKLDKLQENYKDMPFFKEEGIIKIPAGWLIEQCGWKGKRVGNVGVHDKQALVLVNHGGATGEEALDLANKIIASVKDKFDLTLNTEVNII